MSHMNQLRCDAPRLGCPIRVRIAHLPWRERMAYAQQRPEQMIGHDFIERLPHHQRAD